MKKKHKIIFAKKDEINSTIKQVESEGWELVPPITLLNENSLMSFLLTFEKEFY